MGILDFKSYKFLVVGGAGFIGSNIVEKLLQEGHFVRCLDNFSTGKQKNIEEFMSHPNFELLEGDIRNQSTCNEACKDIDYVTHQAAWGSVPRSIKLPLKYEEINIRGTLNMMEAARQNKVKKFVYASSSSVYGDHPGLPKVEDEIGNVLSPYALTKKVNEEYAKIYSSLYNLETVGLRYFNVFGKKQDADGAYAAVIPKFVKCLMNNEAPIIYGDGKQSRDFTYIDNVVDANIKAMKSNSTVSGEVFNIAFGGQVTLLELYKDISVIMNKNIDPIFLDSRVGDIRHSNADISKARKLINYNPKYSFNEGLKKSIDWYKKDYEKRA